MTEDLVFRLKERARIRRSISTRKSVQLGEPDRIADLLEEAAIEIANLQFHNAHNTTLTHAIEVADKERLRIADRYDALTNAGQARMTGNMEWAMLAGAASVVQQLRRLQNV